MGWTCQKCQEDSCFGECVEINELKARADLAERKLAVAKDALRCIEQGTHGNDDAAAASRALAEIEAMK